MTHIEDKFTDIRLQSSVEEDGKFFVIAEALTKDFECEKGLNALAKDVKRQAVTWRHRHPIEDKHKENHIYGRAVDGWVEGSLFVKMELFDHTEDHRHLIEDIKKRDLVKDPLGWSMHYRTYFNEEGRKYHWDVFEIAGTPYPACEDCKTISFGVKKMEGKDKTKEELELEESKKMEEALKTIKDLEAKLNAKSDDFKKLEAKIQKLEADTKVKDKALEDKEKEAKTLEDRVLEMESKIEFMETKKPILDKILEANPEIDELELQWLRSMNKEYLHQRLEREEKSAKSKIQTSEMEAEAAKAKADKEKEDQELEEVTLKHFTSHLEGFEDIKE